MAVKLSESQEDPKPKTESLLTDGQRDYSQLPREQRLKVALSGPTLIFDGICNLCNYSMAWLSARLPPDTPVRLMWAQHPDTLELLTLLGLSRKDVLRSWACIVDGEVIRGADAWLRAIGYLNSPWCWAAWLDVFPSFLKEGAYGVVARNRYRLLGKTDECQEPVDTMRPFFLHDPSTGRGEGECTGEACALPSRAKKLSAKGDGDQSSTRVLVVGLGPASLSAIRGLAGDTDIVIVEPKDFVEFTPGILRGYASVEAWDDLVVPMAAVLAAVSDGSDAHMSWIQGHVTMIRDSKAEVRRSDGSKDEVRFDYALVGTGSRCGEWKAMAPAADPAAAVEDWGGSLVARRAQMTRQCERLKAAEQDSIAEKDNGETERKMRVAVIGAGLVGVELVAEIVEGYPGLRGSVLLCDLAPEILPALPQAQGYCRKWLQNNGVKIVTGPDAAGAADDPDIIRYMCVGNKPVVPEFDPPVSLDKAGHIEVNTAMQVIQADVPKEDGLDLPYSVREVWGAGKVFALGDCCEVKRAELMTQGGFMSQS